MAQKKCEINRVFKQVQLLYLFKISIFNSSLKGQLSLAHRHGYKQGDH